MRLLEEYDSAMAVNTQTEAALWMAAQVRKFLEHWQHSGMGRDEARQMICLNLAYTAGLHGPEAQERVFRLYGALHPLVTCMTKEERKGRQFIHEFSYQELRQAADRWIKHATGVRCRQMEGAAS